MAVPEAIGVDNGGTWIRLCAVNTRGRRLWWLKKPSPSVEQLPAFLKKTLHRFNGRLPSLVVGSRGVWKQPKRRAVRRALKGIAQTIVVMSDVEAAWLAAFKKEGVLIIAGTGSIAYGRRADGAFARAGGLGPDKGDEGSAYWIGKMWLDGRRASGEKRYTVRQISQKAPMVMRKAKAKDAEALAIIREGQFHLADLVSRVRKKLRWKGRIPLQVHGSVLNDPWFRNGFLNELKERAIPFQLIKPKTDAAQALALWSIMGHARRR